MTARGWSRSSLVSRASTSTWSHWSPGCRCCRSSDLPSSDGSWRMSQWGRLAVGSPRTFLLPCWQWNGPARERRRIQGRHAAILKRRKSLRPMFPRDRGWCGSTSRGSTISTRTRRPPRHIPCGIPGMSPTRLSAIRRPGGWSASRRTGHIGRTTSETTGRCTRLACSPRRSRGRRSTLLGRPRARTGRRCMSARKRLRGRSTRAPATTRWRPSSLSGRGRVRGRPSRRSRVVATSSPTSGRRTTRGPSGWHRRGSRSPMRRRW